MSGFTSKAGGVRFFATPEDLRHWLQANHAIAAELWVGFYKRGSGRPSITWPESVDEALCYGWIDGIRKSLGADSYKIRFTPRKAKSTWSAVNIRRVEALTAAGRMQAAGLEAFARRTDEKSRTYAYENRDAAEFRADDERQFRNAPQAWEFFQSQPPSYRKLATWWVISAKRDETRARRLARLISESEGRRRI